MATIANRITGGTVSTADVTSYASASFTPVAGELLVVVVHANRTVAASPTVTASANSLTFTKLSTTATKNTSLDTSYVFVADQAVPSSPAAMTVTFDCTGDAATGTIICVAGIAGMSKFGSTAVRQAAKVDNVAGGTAPVVTLASACLTTNPTIFTTFGTAVGGFTAPTGWTEQVDAAQATPSSSGGYASRDSGFTGTTVTQGNSNNGNSGAIVVEFDASSSNGDVAAVAATATAAAQIPAVTAGATVTSVVATATSQTPLPVATGGATVTSVAVTATASAPAPVVDGGSSPNGLVNAVPATATATAVAPTVAGGALVASVAATSTALALPPTVTAGATVTGVRAQASAAAAAPTATGEALVQGVAATATAQGHPPVVAETNDVFVLAPPATAVAQALAPIVTGSATVVAVRAQATAQGRAPTAAGGALVTPPAARAVQAEGKAPVVTGIQNATIAAPVALAQGRAQIPVVVDHLWRFEPPTHEETIQSEIPPLNRHTLTHAKTIYRTQAGTFAARRLPPPHLITGVEGVDYFLGGRVYEIPLVVAQELLSAGYAPLPL